MWEWEQSERRLLTVLAVALLAVGGVAAIAAGGGYDADRTTRDANASGVAGAVVELDACIAGVEFAVVVGADLGGGTGATVDVVVAGRCDPDGSPDPSGDGTPTPTATATTTPTATGTSTPTQTQTPTGTATPPNDDGGTDGADSTDDGSDGIDDSSAPPVEVFDWWVVPDEVATGEPVTVGVTFRNRYWARQSTAVEVVVDGETVTREYVRVPGEGTTNATFERDFEAPGSYRVGVRGQGTERVRVVGEATATEPAPPTPTETTPTASETPRQEAAALDGGRLLVAALLLAALLGVAGVRVWRGAGRS